jgi:putative transposase
LHARSYSHFYWHAPAPIHFKSDPNVKTESSKWINDQRFCKIKFAWQEGYGAFSYSKSHVQQVIQYIQNQEKHHKKESFLQEYTSFLKTFEIGYEEKYIFKEPE